MSNYHRRSFLKHGLLATLGLGVAGKLNLSASPVSPALIKPDRLKEGDTIAVCSPAGAVFDPDAPAEFKFILESMGFDVLLADSLYRTHGYFSGTDAQRADELNALFANKKVKAIIGMRGGWGSARILPLLDYGLIRNNPKIFMGFSDLSAILAAIRIHSGLITFHGPVGYSTWSEVVQQEFREVLVNPRSKRVIPANDPDRDPGTGVRGLGLEIQVLKSGTAHGELIGGNLKVITSLIGSPYFPLDMKGRILFVEETGEEVYRIDRMLTQLRLAGMLDGLAGFVFGACRKCNPEFPERSFSLEQMLQDFGSRLDCPAFFGARFGHVSDQYIIPVGAQASIDASNGTIIVNENPVN